MKQEELKNIIIPQLPGVYKYLNIKGEIIYVGKAANLKSRVSSYWQKISDLPPVKQQMVEEIKKIEWIETGSEIEALILEANLIKKLKPKYNIALRDDKRHIFIKISDEEWPRVSVSRQLEKSGVFFGPFVSSEAARETIKVIRKIWPYRSCSHLPKKMCLYAQIGLCAAPCAQKVSKDEYKKIIKEISSFLQNKRPAVEKNIKREIIKLDKKLANKNISEQEKEKLAHELFRLQARLDNLAKVLKHSLVISRADKYEADTRDLARIFLLKKIPERIEGYDVSNIYGHDRVGSMVVFTSGEPDRNEYRKFNLKVKASVGLGDTQALFEMLERRFAHSLDNKNSEEESWPLPDLIIIDGGRGQLTVGERILKKFKLDIPLIAVSKGDGLRSARARDKVFFAGQTKPLELSLDSPSLHIIKRVRDEAHRFAITYHRAKRKKRIFK